MKNKILLFILAILIVTDAFSQNWKTGGNNVSPGQWLGSNNPVALPIRVNGVERINIGVSGNTNVTGTLSINNIPVTPSLIDSISLSSNMRRLLSWKNGVSTVKAFLIPVDAGNNAIQGLNSVVNNGINNYIGTDWVTINGGSGNLIWMNHGICEANNTLMIGADGHTYPGADYSTNLGDANDQHGLAGFVMGFGNQQWDAKGFCGGNNSINGTVGQPDLHYSTFTFGNWVKNTGKCNVAFGAWLNVNGDRIMTFGYNPKNTSQYVNITEPGSINFVTNSDRPSAVIHEANGAGTYSDISLYGGLHIPNIVEFPDNNTAVVALGDSGMVYYTTVGTEQILKRTHPASNFNIAPPQNDNTVEQVTREEALRMQGTWSDALGRRVFDLSTGMYILQQGTLSKIVYIK